MSRCCVSIQTMLLSCNTSRTLQIHLSVKQQLHLSFLLENYWIYLLQSFADSDYKWPRKFLVTQLTPAPGRNAQSYYLDDKQAVIVFYFSSGQQNYSEAERCLPYAINSYDFWECGVILYILEWDWWPLTSVTVLSQWCCFISTYLSSRCSQWLILV